MATDTKETEPNLTIASFQTSIDLLPKVATIIREAKVTKRKKAAPNDSSTRDTGSEEQSDNVYYIFPHITADYDSVLGQSIPVPKVIGILELWTESLSAATLLNRDKLSKNKRLLEHTEESLNTCMQVAKSVETILNRRKST